MKNYTFRRWNLVPISSVDLIDDTNHVACCLPPIAQRLLPIPDRKLPVACRLSRSPIAYRHRQLRCLSPNAYRLPPVAYLQLPIAYRPLPIAYL